MRSDLFEVEGEKRFSESLIWQLNQDFYKKRSIDAWREGQVPHNLTSSSMVGKTYAELILGFLKDLAKKGQTKETVYILELGAGHGRLAFHVLKHFTDLLAITTIDLPPFCYVLSDIVAENLTFFETHAQFQPYFANGTLDVAYFDALESKEIILRKANKAITSDSLQQPLLVLANYFFDSLPSDLFYFKNGKIHECLVTLNAKINPKHLDTTTLISQIETDYTLRPSPPNEYDSAIFNEIIEDYRQQLLNTYLLFPRKGMQCLENLQSLSQQGMVVVSMDKGTHQLHNLENKKQPDFVTHGSFSFLVNYHALGAYCRKKGGKAQFPKNANNFIELACLMLVENSQDFREMNTAYQRYVNDYGPNDFNNLKTFSYKYSSRMTLEEITGLLRLSAYDSTLFNNFLPRIKQLSKQVSFNQRASLEETMHATWNMYFTLNESKDLAFEMGGIFYQLGFFQEALDYFQYSINGYGQTADVFYNKALCYYQLREDNKFRAIVKKANILFPDYKALAHLNTLDLEA